MLYDWLTNNFIEIFGAVTGIIYVFLEIRQTIWLWPVGIVTSAVYIWVFFTGKLYADMSLQGYYLVVSILGWYWWVRGSRRKGKVPPDQESELKVSRLSLKPGIILAVVFFMLYAALFEVLRRFTDSPVPAFDSFITSLSIIATWMLARKIYEHWFLWIVVNASASVLFLTRGLYPTVILYIVYCAMSFAGLKEWRKSIVSEKI
jgi:nicotinamide mononucleotide transporter